MPNRPLSEVLDTSIVLSRQIAAVSLQGRPTVLERGIRVRRRIESAANYDQAASEREMARARAIALSSSPMIDPQSTPSSDDTAALVALAARGDVGAFERLYARSAGRVYAVCVRMTGDPQRAREFTHDAFVRAW